jgi:Fe2+ transport system protein FeoA
MDDRETRADSRAGSRVMPLAQVGVGETIELVSVRGGLGLQRRLAEMGLGPGSRFQVETVGRPGPRVISVKGSRLILGHGVVQRVLVRSVTAAADTPQQRGHHAFPATDAREKGHVAQPRSGA